MNKFYWFSINARTDGGTRLVEVRIHDEIGAGGITAGDFLKELDAVAPAPHPLVLSINSPGGSVFDGIAIYNALKRRAGKITGRVDGVAASAASLVLMAAHRIVMPENAMIMIHNPWAATGGEADELRRLADMMDKVRSSFVNAYAQRSGQAASEVARMMDETTWMDAFEAQRLGFCEEIEDPAQLAASVSAINALAKYKGAPTALVASLRRGSQRRHQAAGSFETPQALARYVYGECRARRIPELAEAVILQAVDCTRTIALQRIEEAEEVAGLCLAAKRPQMAADFVKTGLGIEAIRVRLFDMLVNESDQVVISNLQRPAASGGVPVDSDFDRIADNVYGSRSPA